MSLKLSDSMHSPVEGKDKKQPQKPTVRFKPYTPAPEPEKLKPQKTIKEEKVKGDKPTESANPVTTQPARTAKKSIKQSFVSKSWLPTLMWCLSGAMVLALIGVSLSFAGVFGKNDEPSDVAEEVSIESIGAPLPVYAPFELIPLRRTAKQQTIIPERSSTNVTSYPVEALDSVFGVAAKFGLSPYSIIWANDFLESNPQMLSVGMVLNIPPIDGAYYEWQENDTLDSIAGKYMVEPFVILEWPGNHLDLADPHIEPGQYVFIPGGIGKIESFDSPDPYTPNSAVAKSLMNACEINPGYSWGTGGFIWPTVNRSVSGFNYDPTTHKGIDIGGLLGDAVWAADSGVVIWAASMSGGYGQVVFIQHDTSYHVYHTVYAHLSSISVKCGQSVYQGQVIGAVGNSGNSYGAHLHFELRQDGGFLNPLWYLN